ncbi:MAG: TetR family transcriptional regulator [Alphaproteobacteria bacterium]|nr:TetR family transcriptional regulator [Alphaproteobacteria bacterium]
MIQKKKNTREKLIETAIDMIWRSSYGATSVDNICKAADVKKGSFYHYFPSKVDLAVAAMDTCAEFMRPAVDAVFSASIPPVKRFEKFCDLVYEKQKETAEKYGRVCGCPFVSLGSEISGQDEILRKKVEQKMAEHELYYENALRDMVASGLLSSDTDVKTKASKIYAYVLGEVMIARINNDLSALKNDLKAGVFRIINVKKFAQEKETV